MERLFAPTLEEKIMAANKLDFAETELPSILAEKLRNLYPKEFSEDTIKMQVHSRLPSTYRHFLDKNLSLDDYLEKADEWYVSTRSDKKKSKSVSFSKESDESDEELSKKDLTMLQILVNLQDSVKQLQKNQKDLSSETSKLFDQSRVSAATAGDDWNEHSTFSPMPQRTPQKPKNRNWNGTQNSPSITNVTNICFDHQKWGQKAIISNCNPRCKYGSVSLCGPHRAFGIRAFHCEPCNPPCQFIKLTAPQGN